MSKSSNNLYEVEKIKGSKTIKKQKYYLVKWKGYSEKETTWEPLQNFSMNPEIIEEYEKENQEKKCIVIDSPRSDKNTKKLSLNAIVRNTNKNKRKSLRKLRDKQKKNEIKEIAGDFSIAIPKKIKGHIFSSPDNLKKKEKIKNLLYEIEWENDVESGTIFRPSFQSNQDVKENCPKLLCEYYESYMEEF